ncbi:MAG: hypothetical protein ACI9DC_003882 [Gammaproteobacteria bacterium]|jgi:hypothetical protein
MIARGSRYRALVCCGLRQIAMQMVLNAFVSVCATPSALAKTDRHAAASQHRHVMIDEYQARHRPARNGTRLIVKPSPIQFQARLKQYPKQRELNYINSVLRVFPMDPEPRVSHSMFLVSAAGSVFPVYVEDGTVAAIRAQLGEDGHPTRFIGFHVYTYSKGPAILITDFLRKPGP